MKLIIILFHWVGILILLYLTLKLFSYSISSFFHSREVNKRSVIPIFIIFSISFLYILFYQTYFQFFSQNSNFKLAQKKYDRRTWFEEVETEKGRILDRNGFPLATFKIMESKKTPYYPLKEATPQIIGYSSKIFGRSGLELIFSDYLLGKSSNSYKEKLNTLRNNLFRMKKKGLDLYTTLDSYLQKECYKLLKGKKGSITIINPKTGEILAMASSPSFDPNRINEKEYFKNLNKDKNRPFLIRPFQARYPPGSSFKVITSSIALEDEKDTFTALSQSGGYKPPGAIHRVREYLDVKKKGKWKGYGKLNIEKAFVVSSNVYFAKLGVNIGIKKMCEGATKFYFDKQILWNTSNPLLNSFYPIKLSLFSKSIDGRRKNLTLEDIAWQSIGQGEVLVTPLHMALIAGTIANRGIMMMPKIELNKHSEVLTVPITRKTAEKLKEMMTKVVEKGTGRRAKIKGIKIAGKTGTAEVKDKRPHAWFIGFAPAENPKIAFAVIVENRGFGGSVAAPIARKIILKAKELKYF